ncbi:MAG: AAA family ATPase [Polyangiales bacterium]
MDADARNFLREFFRAVSDRPLEPNDPRYVSIYASSGGDDPVELLARAIEWTPGESVQLLSGFRGTGKSTELRRLQARLTASGYKVVLCDIEDYLNLSTRVDVSDFLMALAGAFGDAIVAAGHLRSHPMSESYWQRFSAFMTRTRVEFTELSGGTKLGEISAGLKANLKNDPTFRQRLQERMAGHLGALVTDVRDYITECVQQIKKEHGDLTEVVLLLDSMEHIRGTSVTANEVQSSVETLFAAQSDKLHIPHLHVVYTVPPYLKVRYPNLSALYEPGGVQVLPAIKVKQKHDGSDCAAGVTSMRAVVEKRGDWGRLLGSEARLKHLIESSGGHLRDLLRILAEIVRRADSLPVSDHAVESAVNQIKNDALPIAEQDAVWLARIANTNRASLAVASRLPDLARFLDTHLVLCYRNGDEWYDVHPLIRDEVEAQALDVAKRAKAAATPAP